MAPKKKPKSVKQAKKETKELRSSVKGMLQDRLDAGKPIPARARKNFPKLKARTTGKKLGAKTTKTVKTRAQRLKEAENY